MIDELIALGFTSAEARVYVALLQQPESTGYELAKAAGLQRPNVYSALENLVTKDAATRLDGEPARFLAIPAADVLGRIKRRTAQRVDTLVAELAAIGAPRPETSFYTLRTREAIVDRVASLCDAAQQRIAVCTWQDDMTWLESGLRAAARGGCQVVVNLFGEADIDFGEVYQHESPDRTVGGHPLTLVVDSATAVIADLDNPPSALCTTQPAVVQMAEKLVRDEAYLAAIYAEHAPDLERSFGPHLVRLRARLLPDEQASQLISLVGFGSPAAQHPDHQEG